MDLSILHPSSDGISVVTLNRPERRNAMVPEMMAALANALSETGPARALILTGAGPAFCVGADLKWLGAEADPGEAVGTLVAAHHAAVRAIRAAPVPVV